MKKLNLYISITIALLTTFFITSCSTTAKMDSWTDPASKGRPIGNVMVLGVAKTDAARRQFEELFVQRLNEIGVSAMTSYGSIPHPGALTEAEIDWALERLLIDSVIITKIVDEKERVEMVSTTSHRDLYDHYDFAYSRMKSPEYVQSHIEVDLEMNLYDVATRTLVWSGKTNVTDYKTQKQNMKLVVEGIIKDLQKQGLAPSSK